MKTNLLSAKKINIGLVSVLLIFSSVLSIFFLTPTANALNPIQVLVKQKCPQSADAGERCGNKFNEQLKNRCGKSENSKKYRDCARSFAKSKGATLAADNCWEKCDPEEQEDGGDTGDGGDDSSGTTNSCGGVDTSILSCESPSGTSDDKGGAIWGILLLILNILTAGVGIVAIGGFVYGALIYTAAQDNASQVSKAKEIIFNVVLGLFLYALMYSFLQFIIPGGIFK